MRRLAITAASLALLAGLGVATPAAAAPPTAAELDRLIVPAERLGPGFALQSEAGAEGTPAVATRVYARRAAPEAVVVVILAADAAATPSALGAATADGVRGRLPAARVGEPIALPELGEGGTAVPFADRGSGMVGLVAAWRAGAVTAVVMVTYFPPATSTAREDAAAMLDWVLAQRDALARPAG